MAKTFHLTIAKVGENLFDGEAISATMPGKEGVFQVLAEHEAFVSELTPGTMEVKTADDHTHRFEIPTGGIAEVSRNQATILL
ncbi:MAG: F0F1 ATP synthase subunit epsilon [Candidatus Paceibacterota bacterium]|jgi:F0F1-type ATP synthase epsilon subunit